MLRLLQKWPVHPVAFAAYPALYLYSRNWQEVRPGDLTRPLLFSVVIAAAVTALAIAAARSRHRGALCASILCGAFFAAPMYNRSPLLAGTVWVAAAAIVVAFLFFARKDTPGATPLLNLVAIALLLIPVYTMLTRSTDEAGEPDRGNTEPIIKTDLKLVPSTTPPNIYFILPDAYARADVLRDYYDYDNSAFLDFLKSEGFYVADHAPSNHTRTLAALPTLLNFVDLKAYLATTNYATSRNVDVFRVYAARNRVVWLLRQAGYETFYLVSGAEAYNRISADHYMDANVLLSEFETIFLNFTPIPLFESNVGIRDPYALQRESVHTMVDRFKQVVQDVSGPKFVFLHLMCPHPPFLFDGNGNSVEPDYPYANVDGNSLVDVYISKEQYISGYRDQLIYLNSVLEDVIRTVREQDPNAVVVVQSDHGPGSMLKWTTIDKTNVHERATILNALYLPGIDQGRLYNTLSPINTFPLIFNTYFGTQIPLLPDYTYIASTAEPLRFVRIAPEKLHNPSPVESE